MAARLMHVYSSFTIKFREIFAYLTEIVQFFARSALFIANSAKFDDEIPNSIEFSNYKGLFL